MKEKEGRNRNIEIKTMIFLLKNMQLKKVEKIENVEINTFDEFILIW